MHGDGGQSPEPPQRPSLSGSGAVIMSISNLVVDSSEVTDGSDDPLNVSRNHSCTASGASSVPSVISTSTAISGRTPSPESYMGGSPPTPMSAPSKFTPPRPPLRSAAAAASAPSSANTAPLHHSAVTISPALPRPPPPPATTTTVPPLTQAPLPSSASSSNRPILTGLRRRSGHPSPAPNRAAFFHCPLPGCNFSAHRRFNTIEHFRSHANRIRVDAAVTEECLRQLRLIQRGEDASRLFEECQQAVAARRHRQQGSQNQPQNQEPRDL